MSAEMNMLRQLFAEDASEWKITRHTATHCRTGIEFWIANGCASMETNHDSSLSLPLSFWNKRALWKCYEELRTRTLRARIDGAAK